MKICYVGNINSIHTRRWAKAFALMGHDVHVLYMGGEEGNISNLEESGIKVHLLNRRSVYDAEIAGHTDFKKAPVTPRRIVQGLYAKLPKKLAIPIKMYLVNPKRLRAVLERIQPDILHAWFLYDSGCMAALSGYKPLIVSSWGADVIFQSNVSTCKSRPLWMLEWANRLSLRRADTITATSEYLADKTAKYVSNGKRIHIIPFGIDCEIFSPVNRTNKNESITIGFAKHLLPKYGPDVLLEAFGILIKKYSFLRLKMAGEGHMLSEFQRKVEAMGMKDNVIFLGKIPHEKIPDFLSDVDISVQPSRHDSESFGVAALEASAMEIPVVSTRVGGVSECVKDGETGALVERDNAKALAEAISSLIEDPKKRKQMGAAGRRFVLQNYIWQDNVETMLGIYQRTLEKHK